jgi:hypothetical protein
MAFTTKFLTTAAVVSILSSCSVDSPSNALKPANAVKAFKTRVFYAKNQFDEIVSDKPAYRMGYGGTLGMDFTWNTKYIDEFDNVILQEDFMLDSSGNENVYRKTYRDYFSPIDHKLSSIRTEEGKRVTKETYLRNDKGTLLTLKKEKAGALDQKVQFSYNDTGQRVKVEVFKEDGLVEMTSYVYDLPSFENGKIVKEVHEVLGKDGYREEFEYERANENLITRLRARVFYDGKLQSDIVTLNSNFVKSFATRRIEEGYNSPTKSVDGTVYPSTPFKMTSMFTLNEEGNVIGYTSELEDSGEFSGDDLLRSFRSLTEYKCQYVYDENRNWIKLVFSPNVKDKYILTREITYFEK